MVMEQPAPPPPTPQYVGLEFVRQYYTVLNKAPMHLHRFYGDDSSFVHGGLDTRNREVTPAYGQERIHARIIELGFRDCHAKIRQVDSHSTIGEAIVIQVSGELSNHGNAMRRFVQTFVLAQKTPKKYYVLNDIFRYQDDLDDDEVPSADAEPGHAQYEEPERTQQPNGPTYAPAPTPAAVAPVETQNKQVAMVNGSGSSVDTQDSSLSPPQDQVSPKAETVEPIPPAVEEHPSPEIPVKQPECPVAEKIEEEPVVEEVIPEVDDVEGAAPPATAPPEEPTPEEAAAPTSQVVESKPPEPKTFANLFRTSNAPPTTNAGAVVPPAPTAAAIPAPAQRSNEVGSVKWSREGLIVGETVAEGRVTLDSSFAISLRPKIKKCMQILHRSPEWSVTKGSQKDELNSWEKEEVGVICGGMGWTKWPVIRRDRVARWRRPLQSRYTSVPNGPSKKERGAKPFLYTRRNQAPGTGEGGRQHNSLEGSDAQTQTRPEQLFILEIPKPVLQMVTVSMSPLLSSPPPAFLWEQPKSNQWNMAPQKRSPSAGGPQGQAGKVTNGAGVAMDGDRAPMDERRTPARLAPDSHQLFVGNLQANTSEEEMIKFFGQYGTVLEFRITRAMERQKSKANFGFVVFDSAEPVRRILMEVRNEPLKYKGLRLNIEEKRSRPIGGYDSRSGDRDDMRGGGDRGGYRGGPRGGMRGEAIHVKNQKIMSSGPTVEAAVGPIALIAEMGRRVEGLWAEEQAEPSRLDQAHRAIEGPSASCDLNKTNSGGGAKVEQKMHGLSLSPVLSPHEGKNRTPCHEEKGRNHTVEADEGENEVARNRTLR
ncbi:unnamed protein product [Cyprideis torosa]|uniref:Uncharacterized protein n=1 Tax=Cyprideis torosa TaxID=163714 RepID=A0A7R8W681_9CRUS|nr:unnamed protein product [Cyprideis torosa]CAG0886220.1 unnamed protein product [Cyprideis torosa]